ncbi:MULTISPECIES: phage tail assembly chaperone [unclassified Pseudomonas]|uniref:phage tail assembly chaperone n=1 Tax=unclassified Pseudomonas TaxID=196821 RepID=UPI000A1ED4FC|nr:MULTISPECIES: phage tail assembly chaperone [unclassified Pseudomonas]MDI2141767.1 phage tail protein [Pseudomonas sp. ITA]
MSLFYAASTGGFYDDTVHGVIPQDAVKITAPMRSQLLAGQAQSQVIVADADGNPVLKRPEMDAEAKANRERLWRDGEIDSVKWLRERHRDELEMSSQTTLTVDQYQALLAYLKSLRDWPQSERFPDEQARPKQPDWIALQTH